MVDIRREPRRSGGPRRTIGGGIGVGTVVAGLISWAKWHSFFWLIVHGILGWFYVVYYLLVYGIPLQLKIR